MTKSKSNNKPKKATKYACAKVPIIPAIFIIKKTHKKGVRWTTEEDKQLIQFIKIAKPENPFKPKFWKLFMTSDKFKKLDRNGLSCCKRACSMKNEIEILLKNQKSKKISKINTTTSVKPKTTTLKRKSSRSTSIGSDISHLPAMEQEVTLSSSSDKSVPKISSKVVDSSNSFYNKVISKPSRTSGSTRAQKKSKVEGSVNVHSNENEGSSSADSKPVENVKRTSSRLRKQTEIIKPVDVPNEKKDLSLDSKSKVLAKLTSKTAKVEKKKGVAKSTTKRKRRKRRSVNNEPNVKAAEVQSGTNADSLDLKSPLSEQEAPETINDVSNTTTVSEVENKKKVAEKSTTKRKVRKRKSVSNEPKSSIEEQKNDLDAKNAAKIHKISINNSLASLSTTTELKKKNISSKNQKAPRKRKKPSTSVAGDISNSKPSSKRKKIIISKDVQKLVIPNSSNKLDVLSNLSLKSKSIKCVDKTKKAKKGKVSASEEIPGSLNEETKQTSSKSKTNKIVKVKKVKKRKVPISEQKELLVNSDSMLLGVNLNEIISLDVFSKSIGAEDRAMLNELLPEIDRTPEGLINTFVNNMQLRSGMFEYQDFLSRGVYEPAFMSQQRSLVRRKPGWNKEIGKVQEQALRENIGLSSYKKSLETTIKYAEQDKEFLDLVNKKDKIEE